LLLIFVNQLALSNQTWSI